jgi:predicted lipid-binding transport protein (Tim44 family)
MKSSWFVAVVASIALSLTPALSDAKRLGAGKSSGMQRNMPARTAPDAPPPRQAPTQAAPQNPAVPAQAPAAAPKRSWMGPLAGLAAGLGIGALLSHFGMGGALASAVGGFLMLALLAIAAIFIVRMLMRRNAPQLQPAGAGDARIAPSLAWPPASSTSTPTPVEPAQPPFTRAFVPASFDSESFSRSAKAIFIRMQAANDSGDLDDLRRFTTPEMFAELRLDLMDRKGSSQHTDVIRVDADVLDVADEAGRQVVSVRFHGQVREEAGAAPVDFDEVWHLVKANDGPGWVIAGIEQSQRA